MICPTCKQEMAVAKGHTNCPHCHYSLLTLGGRRVRRHHYLYAILGVVALALAGSAFWVHNTSPLASSGTKPSATASPVAASPATTITNTWKASTVNPKALPLGDGKLASSPTSGSLYTCQKANPNGGGAQTNGPWIHGTTWDSTAKTEVEGSVAWSAATWSITTSGTTRVITTNDLPKDELTGIFPIARTDPAYAYDRNPNHIATQQITVVLPLVPTALATPACAPAGPIGILNDGVYLFNPLDALNRDAVAHETQDQCDGHPDPTSEYHYHDVPSCIRNMATGSSTLVGWAYDGYPIYVERDAAGNLPTNADLDACHGRTSNVLMDGKVVNTYHYDATLEFPYVVGCFHAASAVAGGSH